MCAPLNNNKKRHKSSVLAFFFFFIVEICKAMHYFCCFSKCMLSLSVSFCRNQSPGTAEAASTEKTALCRLRSVKNIFCMKATEVCAVINRATGQTGDAEKERSEENRGNAFIHGKQRKQTAGQAEKVFLSVCCEGHCLHTSRLTTEHHGNAKSRRTACL